MYVNLKDLKKGSKRERKIMKRGRQTGLERERERYLKREID